MLKTELTFLIYEKQLISHGCDVIVMAVNEGRTAIIKNPINKK